MTSAIIAAVLAVLCLGQVACSEKRNNELENSLVAVEENIIEVEGDIAENKKDINVIKGELKSVDDEIEKLSEKEVKELVTSVVTKKIDTPKEFTLQGASLKTIEEYRRRLNAVGGVIKDAQHNQADITAAIVAELRVFLAYKGVPPQDIPYWELTGNKIIRKDKIAK